MLSPANRLTAGAYAGAVLVLVASMTAPRDALAQTPEGTAQASEEDWGWNWADLLGPAEQGELEPAATPTDAMPSPASPPQAPSEASSEAGVEDWGGDWGDLTETSEQQTSYGAMSDAPPAQAPASTGPAVTEAPADVRDGDAPAAITEDWGWDWGDVTETPEQQTSHDTTDDAPPAKAPASAGPTITEGPADSRDADAPAASTEDWGWDWGDTPAEGSADWGTTPITGRPSTRKKRRTIPPKEARVGSTAEPDFDGRIRTGYRLFANAPPFEVIPSKKDPDMHPCLDCHDWAESDHTPRELDEPHDNFKLKHGLHGKGEFWCFTCHHLEGDGGLRTLEGLKVPFDEAYIVCSQCHAQETRDWYFGAHGKRMDNWRGERRLLNCTACHYQHRPKLDPRKAMPGPTVRIGMKRPEHWMPESEASVRTTHKPAWRQMVERRAK